MRILGIDYGRSKIGLAMGETDANLATPFGVVKNSDNVLQELADLISLEGVSKVIVGVPYDEEMELSKQAEEVMLFVDTLKEKIIVPLETIDERFSTAQAKRLMLDDDIKGEDDAIAAMTIVQSYLDQQ